MELAALKSNLEPLQFPDPAERPLQPERKDGSVSQGEERLLKPREVADRFGVSERWVRDHATRRSPRIPVVKLGPLLRFRAEDIDEFLHSQRLATSSKKAQDGV
jgi:predicted DNA-binding transcriptional regulator AlpA